MQNAVIEQPRQGAVFALTIVRMRFCVEFNQLTDDDGKAVTATPPERLRHEFIDATDAAEAIRRVAENEGHEVLDTIHQVAGIQAMATIRKGRRAVMLHAFPAQEAEWRAAAVRRAR